MENWEWPSENIDQVLGASSSRKLIPWAVRTNVLPRQIWSEACHLYLRKLGSQDFCCHGQFMISWFPWPVVQSIQVQNMFEDVLKMGSGVPVGPQVTLLPLQQLLNSQGHVPNGITGYQKVETSSRLPLISLSLQSRLNGRNHISSTLTWILWDHWNENSLEWQ